MAVAGWLLVAGICRAQDTAPASGEALQQWQNRVLPIIQEACLDCHSGETADGSLDLEAFQTVDQVVHQRRLWSKIATRVRDHQMPPEDSVDLSDQDRQAFLDWIDHQLPGISCRHEHHAGPVTIRRLTRYEYANTVRELLKVDYPFTDAFPSDEVGYGFDNIGDVLSMSPLLLEKYLAAAEAISESVILDPARIQIARTFQPGEFSATRGASVRNSFFWMTTTGSTGIEVEPAWAGRYQIEVLAFGDQAGDELPRLAVSVNGKVVDEFEIKTEDPESAETCTVTTKLGKGRNRIEVTFLNDFYNPDNPDRRRRDRNLAVGSIRVQGPSQPPKPSEAQQAFLFVTPDDAKSPLVCAEEIINLHGSRTFRRKVYKHERDRLLQLFELGIENGESFEGAMQLVMQAMLVSPHFLYKVEAPTPEDGSPRSLSDYELASALSYFLWSSMPDDALFRKATAGELRHSEVLESEVRRMLEDPRSLALIDNFASQWLQLRVLDQADPDPELFPGFTNHLKRSMLTETQMLLADVIQKDQPLTTLLTSNYTYVNKTLARHYGWSTQGLREREFSRVSLEGTRRKGLLTHASFLVLTSNPTRTSPVKRGKWVLENLLADPPPPALPDVPQLDSQEELTGTLRERMEQHRADPNCATCHYKMDSLGFALENFDAFGRYRDRAEGKMIDAAGSLPGGITFQSAAELQELIARNQRKQFVRCVVEKLFVYAIGRGPGSTDDCVIDEIANEAFEKDARFSDIVLAIVTSEPFLSRTRTPANHGSVNGE